MFRHLTAFQKEFSHLRGSIITVDGCIGVGKSTLCEAMTKQFNANDMRCTYFQEYVNLDVLNLFIDDMSSNAFAFQLFMLNKRLEIYREAIRNAQCGNISIIDRSIIGDQVFMELMFRKQFISERQREVYFSIRNQEDRLVPNFMFYLEISPENSLTRIRKRDRKGEDAYHLDYVESVVDVHDELFDKIENEYPGQVIRVNWNRHQDEVDVMEILRLTF